jgi:glutathione S-transferase
MKSFMKQEPDLGVMAFLKGRFDGALAIVESHLGQSRFMAGDEPTIADFSLAGYMFYPPEESGYDWPKSNPNLAAWIERMRALPGWKGPYELMPGQRIEPLR